jgi:hypothetical protein
MNPPRTSGKRPVSPDVTMFFTCMC